MGSEKDTEILGLQAVEVYLHKGGCRRTFCIMGQRVNLHSLLKPIGVGIAKASLFKGLNLCRVFCKSNIHSYINIFNMYSYINVSSEKLTAD